MSSPPRILASARKHGISDTTIRRILATPIYVFRLRADPPKNAVLGIDDRMRPIEVVYVINDDGTQVVIHAMPASTAFLNRVRRDRKESR